MKKNIFIPLFLALLVMGSSGCLNLKPAEETTRYFLLEPDLTLKAIAKTDQQFALNSFLTATYLQDSRFIIRRSAHEVIYAPDLFWGERMDKALQRVLLANLARVLGKDQIAGPDYDVRAVAFEIEIQIHRFEMLEKGGVVLEAGWSVRSLKDSRPMVSKRTTLEVAGPSPVSSPDEAVAKMSEALGKLCHEIGSTTEIFRTEK